MLKKVLFGMLAFASLFATSCTNELEQIESGSTSSVSFKVMTPAMESRAYSDGKTATVLQYAVYDAEGNILPNLTKTVNDFSLSTTVNLQLTTGNTYSVIFWAGADGAPYAVDFENKKMTVDYTTADKTKSNDENRDAFYKYHEFTVNGAQTETIELKRPFAQLNIGTADFAASKSAGYVPTYSSVKVSHVYTTLNLATGAVSDETTEPVLFKSNVIPTIFDDTENEFVGEDFPVAGYNYLAMNYLLVPDTDNEVIDVEFTYGLQENLTDAAANAKTRTVGSVPVRRNYRTNIYGNLLTSEVDVKVEINPDFEKPDYLKKVWDGSEIQEPKKNAEDENIYEIEYASELAWLAAAVNGNLEDDSRATLAADEFKGKTFILTEDIDLGGKEWTPIGNSTYKFKGTFDGKGKTVKNLVVGQYENTKKNSNVGLFGDTREGEIKNLVVENAKVSGRLNVGVVAGNPYTSKYTNITVTGHVEVNGMAYVGGVGGKNAYANWTNITVEVDETSYVKANSVENGIAYRTYVGGVVGFNGEGGHKFSNITSNIDVEGSTIDVGGLFGIAHYGNQFENCVCTGNVTITTDEIENALEMGGIAGVWNNGGADVVFTNCTFKGELSTPNIEEEVNFYYGGFVGKPYAESGNGKLYIDGYEMLVNGVALKESEYFVYNADGLRWIATTVNAGTNFKKETIKLVNDIDLSGSEWMPIGYGQNRFSGNFDGQNHTISGMTITEYNGMPQAALFGNISLTTSFKNLIIDGAKVVMPTEHSGDFYAAGLIATFYGSATIDNVIVQNSTFAGNNKVAGLIAHDGVGSNLTINNTHVLKCDIRSTNLTDGGNVGGMIGLFQSGANGEYKISNSSVKKSTIVGINPYNKGKRANSEFVACINSKEGQTLVIENCIVENNNFSQTSDGTTPVSYVGPYDNKFVGGERNDATVLPGIVIINGTKYPTLPVAKVGNTEYNSIDEAIANWTNNSTLTLLDNVTLTDVVTLKSTEHHILNLGTYTMTAADGKNAIEIKACGTGDAEHSTITIKADATNPGGINAGNKSIIYYKYADGGITGNDRPIIKIEGGVFTGSTSIWGTAGIYTIGTAARKCATLNISGGTFNCSINGSSKSKLLISGGVFHYSVGSQGDSTAYRLISGGKFKSLGFMTADSNNTKFWFGSKMNTSDVGLYVDDEGYLVVGGPVITEFGDKFAAKAKNYEKWSSYLKYSSAATNGLYYTNAEVAIAKHGQANVEVKQ